MFKLKSILNSWEKLLFPDLCVSCKTALVNHENHLCLTCELELSQVPERINLSHKFVGKSLIEFTASMYAYKPKSVAANLIEDLKYNGNQTVGVFLGEKLGEFLNTQKLPNDIDFIVPVPLQKSKLYKRGFNQSLLIANGLASKIDLPVNTNAIKRIKQSISQTKKGRLARWLNVSEVFVANKQEVENKHILLIDDVLTTGATIDACATVALEAGARKVSIVTVCAAVLG
jgi:ComF family protein